MLLISYILRCWVSTLSVRYAGVIGKFSVHEIVQGKLWPVMWLLVIVLGLVLPGTVVIYSYVVGLDNVSVGLLYLSIGCELVGDMSMRYLILRAGFYSPLIPGASYGNSAKVQHTNEHLRA